MKRGWCKIMIFLKRNQVMEAFQKKTTVLLGIAQIGWAPWQSWFWHFLVLARFSKWKSCPIYLQGRGRGGGVNLYHAQKKRCFKGFPNVGRFFEKMSKIPYFGYGEMKMTLLLFQARPFETAQIWPEKTKEAGIEEASRTTTRKSWRTRSEAGRV